MEAKLIHWLRSVVPRFSTAAIGIGDDAAVLDTSTGRSVMTADTLMDGVHFLSEQATPEQIGHKAVAVNLSDLAAMGVSPRAVLVSLTIPRTMNLRSVQRVFEGMFPLLETHSTELIGGDTNVWDGKLTISITALGEPDLGEPWLRCSARPGDAIVVSGSLGGSILGKHLAFTPHLELASVLQRNAKIHAATDITDGLARDLFSIIEASDCGAIVDLTDIPISTAAHHLAATSGRSPLEHALHDGEDFELLLTTTPEQAERLCAQPIAGNTLVVIGSITAEQSLLQRGAAGITTPLRPGGYQHG